MDLTLWIWGFFDERGRAIFCPTLFAIFQRMFNFCAQLSDRVGRFAHSFAHSDAHSDANIFAFILQTVSQFAFIKKVF